MRHPHPAAGAHDRLKRRDEAARRSLQDDAAVDEVVDVGLAIRDHDHLRSGQLLVEKLMERVGRPLHMNAVGVFPLEPEFGQHRLDIPPDRHFRLSRSIVCATKIEIVDRLAQRPVPPSEQREHDRRRREPKPRGDADDRERNIEFSLMRPGR
jgi:hypothetical protein